MNDRRKLIALFTIVTVSAILVISTVFPISSQTGFAAQQQPRQKACSNTYDNVVGNLAKDIQGNLTQRASNLKSQICLGTESASSTQPVSPTLSPSTISLK